MFSRRCLKIKTSLWRFVRSTCVIFLTEIRLLKGKRAFSNKNKTKQNRSESLRKWFLTIASIQRHPWEDFFGQHVIFFHKNQAPHRKMCIFKQESDKTKSFWKPKKVISHRCLNTKTSLRRFLRSTCDFFNGNQAPQRKNVHF